MNLCRSTSQDFNALSVRYVIERFLARLARSEYHNRFILKGAMLFIPWNLNRKRTTMDLDLLGTGNPSKEELLHIIQEICNIDMLDGLIFDTEEISMVQIRDKSDYDDIRLNIKVTLGKMKIKLQIDIGLGDQVFPDP